MVWCIKETKLSEANKNIKLLKILIKKRLDLRFNLLTWTKIKKKFYSIY